MEKARISEEAYTRALPEEDQAIELLENAYALRKRGDMAGAVQQCERALKIAPDSAAAHSLLGQMHAAQGERERAIREYEEVLRLNPGSIADRVKLDELRDARGAKAKRVAPVLAAAKEPAAPSLTTLISIGAAAIALIAAGVALSHPSRSNRSTDRDSSRTVASASGPQNAAPVSSLSGAETAAPVIYSDKTSVADGANASKTGQAVPASSLEPNAAPPAAKTNPNPFVLPPAPTISLPAMPPAPATPAAKAKPKRPADKKPSSPSAPTDDRIVLSGDGNSGEGDHYVIRINAGGAGGDAGGAGKNSVVVSRSGGAAENPPASSSRSAISIADDLRYKGEFDKAIQMYQRALPGAGDRAAHVYHQMAYCFQAKGDKSSAKVNYERAIEAYQKLAASGQDAESAQTAIRVCQRGIKICE